MIIPLLPEGVAEGRGSKKNKDYAIRNVIIL